MRTSYLCINNVVGAAINRHVGRRMGEVPCDLGTFVGEVSVKQYVGVQKGQQRVSA